MGDLKTTAEERAGYPCPKCGKDTVRTQVSLTVDIPSALEHHLSKRNIATRDVVVMGASWDSAASYCPCGWNMSLLKTRLDTLLAEVERLRGALFPIATGRFASIAEVCNMAEGALGADAVAEWSAAENARAALGEP